MLKLLPFRIIYFKQQNNILWCFWSLKFILKFYFEILKVYVAISFSALYFAIRYSSYSWKRQVKFFAQN